MGMLAMPQIRSLIIISSAKTTMFYVEGFERIKSYKSISRNIDNLPIENMVRCIRSIHDLRYHISYWWYSSSYFGYIVLVFYTFNL